MPYFVVRKNTINFFKTRRYQQ